MTAPDVRRTRTPKEVAQILGLEYETVLGLIHEKRLHAVSVGPRYLVPVVAIEKFLADGAATHTTGDAA